MCHSISFAKDSGISRLEPDGVVMGSFFSGDDLACRRIHDVNAGHGDTDTRRVETAQALCKHVATGRS